MSASAESKKPARRHSKLYYRMLRHFTHNRERYMRLGVLAVLCAPVLYFATQVHDHMVSKLCSDITPEYRAISPYCGPVIDTFSWEWLLYWAAALCIGAGITSLTLLVLACVVYMAFGKKLGLWGYPTDEGNRDDFRAVFMLLSAITGVVFIPIGITSLFFS